MTSDFEQFLEIMNGLLADERFQLVAGLCKQRHWLDVQRLTESNCSDFLLWLLDPRQGHGLGDYFLRRLLIATMSAEDPSERMAKWIREKAWPSMNELDQMSFANTFVIREVVTGNKYDVNGRIDLLVVDPINKLLIVIERKDGARLQPGQLAVYQNWANDRYPSYRQLWLVLDSYDLEHEHINDDWLQLNDDWLISALSDVIGRERIPERIGRQLQEVRLVLSGEYVGHEDPYFNGFDEALDALVSDRMLRLGKLRELKISVGPDTHRLVDLDEVKAVSILPHLDVDVTKSGVLNSDLLAAVVLAVRYHWVLFALLDRNRLASLKQRLEEHSSFRDRFILEAERDRSGADSLSISLKRFATLDKWPFWVTISVPGGHGNESSSSSDRQFMRLDFDTQRNPGSTIPDGMWPKLATEYKVHKNRANQRWVRSKPEYIDELSVTAIEPLLKEMLVIEERIRTEEKQRKTTPSGLPG